MTSLNYAKAVISEANDSYADFMSAKSAADNYAALPWYKRIFVSRPKTPRLRVLSMVDIPAPLGVCVNVRVHYTPTRQDVFVAVNEWGYGYKVNVATGEKSPLIGAMGMNVSDETASFVESIRLELTRETL